MTYSHCWSRLGNERGISFVPKVATGTNSQTWALYSHGCGIDVWEQHSACVISANKPLAIISHLAKHIINRESYFASVSNGYNEHFQKIILYKNMLLFILLHSNISVFYSNSNGFPLLYEYVSQLRNNEKFIYLYQLS